VSENRVTIIEGRGQMVYWKAANVTVLEKNTKGEEERRWLTEMPDGQGRAEFGTNLYITDGKVQEVD